MSGPNCPACKLGEGCYANRFWRCVRQAGCARARKKRIETAREVVLAAAVQCCMSWDLIGSRHVSTTGDTNEDALMQAVRAWVAAEEGTP